MKLGIIIYSNDPETITNAFRLGVSSLKQGETVSVSLLGKGVEAESQDDIHFEVDEHMYSFVQLGGKIFVCDTCINNAPS